MVCPIVKGKKSLQSVFGIKSHLPPAVRRLVGVDFEVGADGFFEELFYVLQSYGGGTEMLPLHLFKSPSEALW